MPLWTMCFFTVDLMRLTSPNIFSVRHRLHVLRVDTRPVAAKMVYLKAVRDRANNGFIRPTMRPMDYFVFVETAVTIFIELAEPFPTTAWCIYIDFLPKSLFYRATAATGELHFGYSGVAVTLPSPIVSRAITMPYRYSVASINITSCAVVSLPNDFQMTVALPPIVVFLAPPACNDRPVAIFN